MMPPVTHGEGRVNGHFVIWDPFSSSLRNTHLHSPLGQPVILMVKHISDVVLCNLPTSLPPVNLVRGPGCDTPDIDDGSD